MTMAQLPQVRVEVAFTSGASTGSMLTLDDPSRGKLDTGTLGSDSSPDPVWTDISEFFYPGSVTRGSTRVDSPIVTYDSGTCSITLDNSDRRFDPNHLEGPYTEETAELSGERTVLNTNTDFESGTTGWTGFGCTFTQANDQVFSGSWSAKLVPTGASMFVSIDSDQVPITEGDTYTGTARVRCAVTRTILVKIDWYSAAGGFPMASSFSDWISLNADAWTLITFTATAPAGAVAASLVPLLDGTPPASDVLWVDEAELAHMPYLRVTQVTAMRAVRIMATWQGATYELFRGFADLWDVRWAGTEWSECVLTASDGFKVLAGIDRQAELLPVGGGETSGARVNRILNSADWPADDRIVATGDSTLQETTLDGDVLAELQLVAGSELGELYMDGGGRLVFRNRLAAISDTRSTTSQAVFGDGIGEMPYQDLGTANDDVTFFNEVRVTRVGGDEQMVADTASQVRYYRKTYRPSTQPILQSDEDAMNYAAWLLHIASEPEIRFTEVRIAPTDDPEAMYPHALGRELGDRITIIRRPPGGGTPIQRDQFIRGIKHEFDGGRWTTTWILQDASRYGSFLVLDNPTVGQLDINALGY